MRRIHAACLLGVLMLAGCSKPERSEAPQNKFGFPEEPQRVTTADISEGAAPAPAMVSREGMAAPGVNVTAAPGVAFNYRYAFVLPDKAISAVQEQHAAACEKLGPQRCRITGMHYTLVDENEVRGQLQFKLDPALARNFGKEGIAAVERAKGKLVDAAIEGTDVGSQIDQSQRRSRQMGSELERIEKRLAQSGLGDSERAELTEQAARLRQQQIGEQDTRDQGEEMLANTPMTFNYAGRQGFSIGDDPIGDAWDSSQSSFVTMVTVILVLLGTLLPWALLAALLVFLWRKTPLNKLRLRRKREAAVEREVVPAVPPGG